MKIAIIKFEGVDLISIYDENTGDKYVALRPIVEGLGLNWATQTKKIKRLREEGVVIRQHPVNYYRLKSVASVGVCRLMRPYPTQVVTTPYYRYLSVYLDRLTATFTLYYFAFVIYISRLSFIVTHLGQRDMLKFILKRILKMSSGCIPVLKNRVLAAYFSINPRVEPDNLKSVIQEAIAEYEKNRTELITAQMEKLKIQKSELARRYVATLKDLDFIDRRYLKRLAEFGISLLTGDLITEKQQISIEEFLKAKRIYDRGLRTSFGLFLSKFYKKKTGKKPKKALAIINGKETFVNYYTIEELPILEEAFKEWNKKKFKRKN